MILTSGFSLASVTLQYIRLNAAWEGGEIAPPSFRALNGRSRIRRHSKFQKDGR